MLSLLAAAVIQSGADTLLAGLRDAVSKGPDALRPYWADPNDAAPVIRMTARGEAKVHVHVIPTPPGWEPKKGYWAIFSRPQGVEGLHDPVFMVGADMKLGKEIPEWMDSGGRKPKHLEIIAKLDLKSHSAEIFSTLTLDGPATGRALVFRLNENYIVTGFANSVDLSPIPYRNLVVADKVPRPKNGDVVRAGGLLIDWRTKGESQIWLNYRGTPAGEDSFNDRHAYFTGYWTPSLSRLPVRTTVGIVGPSDWVLRSEGLLEGENTNSSNKVASFHCDIPISFPKIVAGKYVLAAEKKDGGRTFRSWQFAPIDQKRADFDVNRMAEMAKFCDQKMVKFPFPGYECFDGEKYYGIESYSYTLLDPGITSRYVAHEMGHTYFGGMAPCTYIKDTWNEGVTTYLDDVLSGRMVDRPLEEALNQMTDHRPLSRMNFDAGETNATYWRGAYVMKMLEHEIGPENVLKALRSIVIDRQGKDTTWPDLRPAFERASSQKLAWFWDQWITNGVFPTVTITAVTKAKSPTKDEPQREIATVTLEQSGTPTPFRLRFPVVLTNGEEEDTKEVLMTGAKMTITIPCETPVRRAVIRPLGYGLIHIAAPKDIP